MGVLGHLLEAQGIATAGISFIREHTAAIRPPRALVVPFELGRPFGLPDEPAYQTRVIEALLATLGEDSVPVLADFSEPYPPLPDGARPWTPPAGLPAPPDDLPPTGAGVEEALGREIAFLKPLWEEARARRGGTAVNLIGWPVERTASSLVAFLFDAALASPKPGMDLAPFLRLGAEDLKYFHLEAATARSTRNEGLPLATWLWKETFAGLFLAAFARACKAHPDEAVRAFGIVPSYER